MLRHHISETSNYSRLQATCVTKTVWPHIHPKIKDIMQYDAKVGGTYDCSLRMAMSVVEFIDLLYPHGFTLEEINQENLLEDFVKWLSKGAIAHYGL